MRLLGDRVELKPERYAIDRKYDDVFYVPENADFLVREGCVRWPLPDGGTHSLVLRAGETYVLPWGTKIRLEKQPGGTAWRLIASRADGILCHKPCTVSGGGKSEISKSLRQHHPAKDRSSSAIITAISPRSKRSSKKTSRASTNFRTKARARQPPDPQTGALARLGD